MVAVAACWPAGREVVVVEADPFGGEVAGWAQAAPPGGVWSLLPAARSVAPGTPADLSPHVCRVGPVQVVVGWSDPRGAWANDGLWAGVAQLLGDTRCDVLVDVGRLVPSGAGGMGALLGAADVTVVMVSATLGDIARLRMLRPLLDETVAGELVVWLGPREDRRWGAAEITTALQLPVAEVVPFDAPGAAGVLGDGWPKRRGRLGRWAQEAAGRLVALDAPAEDVASSEGGAHVEEPAEEADMVVEGR